MAKMGPTIEAIVLSKAHLTSVRVLRSGLFKPEHDFLITSVSHTRVLAIDGKTHTTIFSASNHHSIYENQILYIRSKLNC